MDPGSAGLHFSHAAVITMHVVLGFKPKVLCMLGKHTTI